MVSKCGTEGQEKAERRKISRSLLWKLAEDTTWDRREYWSL